MKYISDSTNNSISLPFFFFFVISLLGEIRSTRVPAVAAGYTVGNYIVDDDRGFGSRRGREIHRRG